MKTSAILPILALALTLPSCKDSNASPQGGTQASSAQTAPSLPGVTPAQQQKALNRLIRRGTVANAQGLDFVEGAFGRTPLMNAADAGDTELVELLLTAGADISLQDANGQTALHLAAASGHVDIVRLLLRAGADVNAQDPSGWTPINQAATVGHAEVVQVLLQAGADTEIPNNGGRVPLQQAAGLGHADVVRVLLTTRVDVNHRSLDGETPIMAAVISDNPEIIRMLLAAGANPKARDVSGFNAMDIAIVNGKHNALLALGGNENTRISRLMVMPNGKAPTKGQALRFLIGNGYLQNEAQLNEGFIYGFTLLDLAAMKGNTQMVALLLAAGADVNRMDELGRTPLFHACLFGREGTARLLILAGADVNASYGGISPIELAAANYMFSTVDLLRQAGAREPGAPAPTPAPAPEEAPQAAEK